jgi:hypothetical protein
VVLTLVVVFVVSSDVRRCREVAAAGCVVRDASLAPFQLDLPLIACDAQPSGRAEPCSFDVFGA